VVHIRKISSDNFVVVEKNNNGYMWFSW